MQKHFLCIGAARSGTTWLYVNLRQHPEIWLPPLKEIHFFDRQARYPSNTFLATPHAAARAAACLRSNAVRRQARLFTDPISWAQASRRGRSRGAIWALSNTFRRFDEQWYASLFSLAGDKVTGDVTPSYALLSPEDAKAAVELMPNTKCIAILRDPIDRTWSNISFVCRRRGLLESELSLEQLRTIAFSPYVLPRSDYTRMLRTWMPCTKGRGLLLLAYEQIRSRPEETLRSVYDFLELRDRSFICEKGSVTRYNAGNDTVIPAKLETELARHFHPMLLELEQLWGSQAAAWRTRCENTLEGGL